MRRNSGLSPTNEAALVGRRERPLQQAGALPQRAPLDGPLHADLDLVQRARLGDVIERARRGWIRWRVSMEPWPVSMITSIDGLRARMAFKRRQAVHPRQAQIQQHDLRLLPLQSRHRFLAGSRRSQRRGPGAAARPTSRGGKRHRHPPAGSTQWSSCLHQQPAARFQTSSPGPARSPRGGLLPIGARSSATGTGPAPCRPGRALKNGSKMRFRSSGAMPQPLSITRTRTCSPASASTVTRPPGLRCLHGVQQQVDQGVLQLRFLGAHVHAGGQRPHLDRHRVLARGGLDQPRHRGDHRRQVHHFPLRALARAPGAESAA